MCKSKFLSYNLIVTVYHKSIPITLPLLQQKYYSCYTFSKEKYILMENMETSQTQTQQESQRAQELNAKRFTKISWQAREYEKEEKNIFVLYGILFLLTLMVIYGIASESPIMAITFILIGVVLYLRFQKESPLLNITIDFDGVHVNREVYPYENIQSFWIFYEPGERKVISLHTNADLTPYVHIPIGSENPVKIRETLEKLVPEETHPIRLVDILEKYF